MEGEVVDARTAAVRPVRPCVSMHHCDIASRVESETWMTVSKPVGSRRFNWASVMKQQIWRILSVSGFRPVIWWEVSGGELRNAQGVGSEMGCLDVPRSRSRPKDLLSVRAAWWICGGWGLFWAIEAVNDLRCNWVLGRISDLVEKAGLGQNTA